MTSKTLWLFTATVFAILLLPALVQEGMFLDGVTYACIARNMANGLGSFSQPYYTAALYPVCYEQPPLALWIHSLFFKIFGDHFWVERLHTFCLAVLTAAGIWLNWRLLKNALSAWIPILIWITMPLVHWSYQNNMLECAMSVFILLATYFATKSVQEKNNSLLVAATFLTAAAVLCKGPVGFFPVAVPVIWSAVFRTQSLVGGAVRSAMMLIVALVLLWLFILFVPGMRDFWDYYLQKQLLSTLSGERGKQEESQLKFFWDLLSQFVLPALALALLFLRLKFRKFSLSKSALFFILIGVAGAFPLAISPKQSTYYLLPSMPFFALGFGAIIADLREEVLNSTERKPKRWAEKVAWLILLATVAISISFLGKYRRDEVLIKDVKAVCEQVGKGAMLGIPTDLSDDWPLIAYFGRFGNVSLHRSEAHDFYLTGKNSATPEGYEKLETELGKHDLWERK